MSKILFFACAYNRPKVLRLALMGLNRLKQVHDFEVLIACSDKESLEVCEEFGVDCYEYKNLPIGEKKNDLVKRALDYKVDYFIEFSDDDLMSNKLFEAYLKEMQKGSEYIKAKGLYFYDTKTKRALDYDPTNTFGAFRVFKRSMLEKVGLQYLVTFRQNVNNYKDQSMYWINKSLYDYLNKKAVIATHSGRFELWHPNKNQHLDFSSECGIVEMNVKETIVDCGTPQIIDVKSDQNIWKFERYWTSAKDVKPETIFKLLSKEEIKYLKTL